jgi:MFS family permease
MKADGSRLAPAVRLPSGAPFRWFFAGRTVSLFGTSMAPLALAFAVLELSGDIGDLGAVLAARSIPTVMFILLGGAVADKFSRSFLLQLSNLGAGLTQACAAALLISGNFNLVLLLIVEFINGTLVALSSPAQRGIVPQIVGTGDIQSANSALAVAGRSVSIVGPAIGGLIVTATSGGWALAIDAASYLVAAICMRQIRLDTLAAGVRSNLIVDLREGWVQFRSTSWLWTIVAAFAVMNFIQAGAWFTLGPVVANGGIGAAGWGLVLSAQTVGVLLVSGILLRISVKRFLFAGQLLVSLVAAPMIALGLGLPVYLIIVAGLFAGIGIGAFGIAWETSLQQHIPNRLLSRVASYDDLGSFVAIPLGQLSAAPMASLFGAANVTLAGGILYFVAAALPLAARSVRHLVARGFDGSSDR